MRILHVAHGFPPETSGGTERTVEALARAMQRQGHEVAVAAGSLQVGHPARVGHEDHSGLEVWRLHRDDLYFESWFKAWSPGVSAAFGDLLARLRPDVVHVHHWIRLSSDLVRRARAAGCLAAVTLHDYYAVLATPVRRGDAERAEPPAVPGYVGAAEATEAFALHRRDLRADIAAAHLRLAPSRSHAEGVQALAPGPLGDIEVSAPPMLERPPRRTADGARGRRLVAWGSFYPDKGLDTVLDAMRAVGGWSLDVWGDAHDPEYRSQLRARGQGLDVRFRGEAFGFDDLAATAADYAVLPSVCHESYGLTLDEALCIGWPVLASDLPVYRERAPRRSRALFAPGDARALADLLRDEERLAGLVAPDPPQRDDADAAAAALLDAYTRAGRGEVAPGPAVPQVTGDDRAVALFRRAERRLWSALQGGMPPPPDDDFLGG